MAHMKLAGPAIRHSTHCSQSYFGPSVDMYGHRFHFVGILWIVVDYRKPGKGMPMSKKQRKGREIDIEDAVAGPLTRRSIKRAVTYSGLGLVCAMVITAWVVFVKYLIWVAFVRNWPPNTMWAVAEMFLVMGGLQGEKEMNSGLEFALPSAVKGAETRCPSALSSHLYFLDTLFK
jgi:hypothetical protein